MIFVLFSLLCHHAFGEGPPLPVDTVRFGPFGKVAVYRPDSDFQAVILFVSGDGGWNKGVVDMAGHFVKQGALVAGIDIRHYFRELKNLDVKCYYPAGDFEELSIFLQRKYKLPEYMKPILVGYSSGATLVYGLLAQAPDNTFRGAIALGFCPDLETDKPLCEGLGLRQHVLKPGVSWYLEASGRLTAPFIALHGLQDQVCPFEATKEYMAKVKGGILLELPRAGHGFSVTSSWLPQFIQAFEKVKSAPPGNENHPVKDTFTQNTPPLDLPADFQIVPVPANTGGDGPLAFLISGDGGWTGFDYSIAKNLALKGIPVVGLDAQKFFWNFRSPEQTTALVSQTLTHYLQKWEKRHIILVGYSFGGCIIPFIASRLTGELKNSLQGVYCLSPDETVDFEVHITDMIGLGRSADSFRVPDEITRILPYHPVCIYGISEDARLRTLFANAGAAILTVPGNHHYNNNPAAVAKVILDDYQSNVKH